MGNWAQKKKKPEVKGNGGGDAYSAMKTKVPDLGDVANDIDRLLAESEERDREDMRERERERRARSRGCGCG